MSSLLILFFWRTEASTTYLGDTNSTCTRSFFSPFSQRYVKEQQQVVYFPLLLSLSPSLPSLLPSFPSLSVFPTPLMPSDLYRNKFWCECVWFCASCPFNSGQSTRKHPSCFCLILCIPGRGRMLRGIPREHLGAAIWRTQHWELMVENSPAVVEMSPKEQWLGDIISVI